MSTVVLSLFGDEIIPEQINAVGKSRAARKPKVAAKKEEVEPDIAETVPELRQEDKSLGTAVTSDPPIAPVEFELAPDGVVDIYPAVVAMHEGKEEIIPSIAPSEPEVSDEREEIVSLVVEAVQDVKHEMTAPIGEVVSLEPDLVSTVIEAKPEPIDVARETKLEEPLSIAQAIPERIEVAQIVVDAVPEVAKTTRKPAAKKAKPAAKKTTVKKEVVKREKPEGHNILEGWTPDKQYYSIGEVAGLFYVATSHIRFWTNEFALKVRTTRKGDRLYSPEQINELRTIYHLVKEKGYTIAGAKARLKEAKKTPVHTLDLKQSLLQLRNKLVDIKNQL